MENPRIVEDYLSNTPLNGNRNIYLFVTTCGSPGNAKKYMSNLCKDINLNFLGIHTCYMPGSYVAFMENPDIEHADDMNRKARKEVDDLLTLIKNGHNLPDQKVSALGKFISKYANPFFYNHIIGKDGFYTTDHCVACGKCAVVCPLNNIQMVDKTPQWGNQCTHCMACIHQCPTQAVEFKSITVGKNRYYNKGLLSNNDFNS